MTLERNDEPEIILESENETADELDIETEDALAKDKLKDLRSKLAKCESEKKEYLDGWQRSKADFLNQKRRSDEDRARDKERSKADFIESILPLCDSFEMAFKDKDSWEKADASWRKGIESIHGQLERLLREYNVTKVAPVGEQFNPHEHEAISTREDGEGAEGTILEVLQSGYKMGDTLIRPAKVVINQ